MSNIIKVIVDFAVLDILYKVVFLNRWKAKGKAKLFVNTII
jgi:hypothetical protein